MYPKALSLGKGLVVSNDRRERQPTGEVTLLMLLRGQTAALPFRRVCGCISLISWDWSRLIYSSLGIKEAMLCFFLLLWCPLPPLRWGGCSPARGRHFTGQQNHPSNFARLCQNTHHAVVFFSRV